MPAAAATSILLLLISFTLRLLSSTSALHHRRILHQPFLSQDSSPPIPSPPSPPKYPFSGAAPGNSPFFPLYPSPPPPPSPASFATFPANISSLTVPHSSKPRSSSSKLIAVAVAAVIAAVAVVSLAVFLHLRSRSRTHGSSSFDQSKTQRSDNISAVSYNQTPSTHHLPKLQRPSQTSSEFLYLGTMVNSHAAGGGAAFNGSRTNCSSAANSRKMESPELRPLPPLNTQQSFRQNFRNNADVVSSKDDESEEFYSPKGSINGRESSIGTGSTSRRAFAAIEVENFNGSTSNSSSTYSSSVPGSGSGSPARSLSSSLSPVNNLSPRSSMPKSPDLIEIQTSTPLPPQMPFQESASPSPPSSSSPERYSRRSEESSPRISNVSDQNVESPMRHSSSVQHNPIVIPTPTEIQGSVFPESASPLPPSSLSPERYSKRSDEPSPRNSNASDQNVESPVRISSPALHKTTATPTPSEIRGPDFPESASPLPPSSSSPVKYSRSEESSPRASNASHQNVESPVRIVSTVQHNTSEIQGLVIRLSPSPLLPSSSSPVACSRSEESSPRTSNASNQNVESLVKISSPVQHNNNVIPKPPEMHNLVFHESASALPLSAMSPEKYFNRSEESSPRSSNVSDQNQESPVRISSPVQHNNTVIPTPPEMQNLVFHESASALPLNAMSPEKYFSRSEESLPRSSNVSDQNQEYPVRISSPVQHNNTVIPTPPEMQNLVFHESASALPLNAMSPEKYFSQSEESSPRSSNVSDQHLESLVRISSPVQHDNTVIPTPPEMRNSVFPESASALPLNAMSPEKYFSQSKESSPRTSNASNQNVESLMKISSPVQHNNNVIPTPPEMHNLVFHESASALPLSAMSPEKYFNRSEESSPRSSNVSDQNQESPVRISCPVQQNNTVIPTPPEMQNLVFHESASALPLNAMSPEKYFSQSEESSPRSSNVSDQNLESPVRISSPVQHDNTVIPTPPEMQNLAFHESASALPLNAMSPEKYFSQSEESSSRSSNVADQNQESPVRISGPVQHNNTVIPTPPEMQNLVFPESASALPLNAMSPEKYFSRSEESSPRNSNVSLNAMSPKKYFSRSKESSPRNSNVSDQNVESPVRISSTDVPPPPEMQVLLLQESASPLPLSASSPEKCLSRSEKSSPRSSNVSNQHEESPVIISSSDQHNSTLIPTPPEMQDLEFQESAPPLPPIALSLERYSSTSKESSPRISNDSDQNVEFPVRVSSPVQHNATVNPTSPEIESLVFLESALPMPVSSSSPERYSGRIEESLPRISNVSDQNVESDVRISSPIQHKSPSPMSSSSSSPKRCSRRSEESSPRISSDLVQSVHDNASVIPPPPPPWVSVSPPPPPPPPPQSKVSESPRTPTPPAKKPLCEPPALIMPLRPIAIESPTLISPMELPSMDSQTGKKDGDDESPNKETEYSSEEVERNGESNPKPKLKPLHWDKVRASSDREMVWDQLKCSSFKLNEEMIETLFVVNAPQPKPKETSRWQVLPSPGLDNGNRVLDPKKAQNIAILLRALHVTVDEVCEGLLEGNADILGTELLESLLKMAPTKEEERKLKEYKDDSPVKLGAAERFLKAVVDIPYAFKRVDVMLYVSNFESEVEYLKKSFATLEAACEELRTSRMFLKLLEAVLKTGNRMNVGTNRGDAHAFKLDTLLKLVDVKGADGKTTLLHFVVQEIIRTEGARLSGGTQHETSSTNDDAKCRKLGLQVVSALSSELSNVKKAAVMDAEVLSSDVFKLSKGIENIKEIIRLNETVPSDEHKFSDSMNKFMKRAEEEIFRIQAQESVALTLVKEITEYFHGNSAKEEAHPFRIFMVVRDFLTILDRVCKEVGMINERTMVSSAHKFPVPVNPMLQPGFHKRQHTSSDDESFPLNL